MYAPTLLHHVRRRRDDPAFRHGDDELTWAELDRRSSAFARRLIDLGVERGDRVASFLGTSLDLVVAFLGVFRAGAIWVPVNDRYGPTEIRHIVGDSGARIALTEATGELREVVAGLDIDSLETIIARGSEDWSSEAPDVPLREPGPDDPVLFIYTSGTTGPSKGVVHTNRSLTVAIDSLTRLWRWTTDDTLVLALPLFHVHGFGIGVVGTLLRGNDAVLLDRFEPTAVIQTVSAGGTIFMGVPTMYARLLRTLDETPALASGLRSARLFTSGSDALPAENFERFEELTGHRILERYGMSETMLTLSNPYEPQHRRPGAVGFPVPGMQARIFDEHGKPCAPGEIGELRVRGPFVMREYWENPDTTAASFDGDWFITGDVGFFDEDGYVNLVGRKSVDIIKSGGFKISAKEIEGVLRMHSEVEQVAVLGIPDDEWGERIGAVVVPTPGVTGSDELSAALAALVRDQLADYKAPRDWRWADALPRNALGKVQKRAMLELFD